MNSLIRKKFNISSNMPDIFPSYWQEDFKIDDVLLFRNLDNFVNTVSKLTQIQDYNCDITYEEALKKLISKKSDITETTELTIKNKVKENLHKRGLITEELYENFKYAESGTGLGVDIGKYASGDPDCLLVPSRQYIDYFYELYVSISYPAGIPNSFVVENVIRLLATLEELEKMHVFVKISVVLPIECVARNDDGSQHVNFFSSIPVFSHKDPKIPHVMSSVINERLLRKFYFAVLEDMYGNNLSTNYGFIHNLKRTINIGENFDEVELFERILSEVGVNNDYKKTV